MFDDVEKRIVPGSVLFLSEPGTWEGVRCWYSGCGIMLLSVELFHNNSPVIKIKQDQRKCALYICKCILFNFENTDTKIISNSCWIELSESIDSTEEGWLNKDYLWVRENVTCYMSYRNDDPNFFINPNFKRKRMRVIEILD